MRVFALLLVACFVLLFLQLGNIQVRQSNALRHSPYTASAAGDPFAGARGEIVSSDGYVLAKSVPSKGSFPYQRVYPQGSLFADVTGYVDVVDSNISTGLEAEYGNPQGAAAASQYLLVHQYPTHGLNGLLTTRKGTDTITTTVSRRLQLVAERALGSYAGAVVALDPRNGDILAMYSNPSFNPNKLASHDPKAVARYYSSLHPASGSSPLVNATTDLIHAPGSTFKIVTSSAVFDHKPSIAKQYFKPVSYIKLPNTSHLLHNYASEVCGGDIAASFAQSCDTAFGKIGMELGPANLAKEAHAFGFDKVPPIDLPPSEVRASNFPSASSFTKQDPVLAYSAIGQENVAESPLQDALVAGAVADGGTIMAPHLLSHVINDEGNIVATYHPHVWRKATSPDTAATVRAMMRGVVTDPNGTAAGVGFPPSLHVAAKTGTSQVGALGCSDNWLVATAPAGPGDVPRVAVAAFVPYQTGLSCSATGAQEAGPVVKAVLEAALGYGG